MGEEKSTICSKYYKNKGEKRGLERLTEKKTVI